MTEEWQGRGRSINRNENSRLRERTPVDGGWNDGSETDERGGNGVGSEGVVFGTYREEIQL